MDLKLEKKGIQKDPKSETQVQLKMHQSVSCKKIIALLGDMSFWSCWSFPGVARFCPGLYQPPHLSVGAHTGCCYCRLAVRSGQRNVRISQTDCQQIRYHEHLKVTHSWVAGLAVGVPAGSDSSRCLHAQCVSAEVPLTASSSRSCFSGSEKLRKFSNAHKSRVPRSQKREWWRIWESCFFCVAHEQQDS